MMAWLVGAAVWLWLIAASHGLSRLVVLAVSVAWLVWRSPSSDQAVASRSARP
jgi:hypothetical protein